MHYQHYHNYLPKPLTPTLTEKDVGRGKYGGRTSETQSYSHSSSLTSRLVIYTEVLYQPHAGPYS